MTLQAERSHVRQIAFATALRNGHNVIGIPKSLASAKSPVCGGLDAGRPSQMFHVIELRNAVKPTLCADAAISFEHPLA